VTAYIRVLGGTLGLPQDFRGPMAKPHRMAALTIGCLLAIAEHLWFAPPAAGGDRQYVLTATAVVIAIGTVATCFTRVLAIGRQLRARP
jgi:hypothetical protein